MYIGMKYWILATLLLLIIWSRVSYHRHISCLFELARPIATAYSPLAGDILLTCPQLPRFSFQNFVLRPVAYAMSASCHVHPLMVVRDPKDEVVKVLHYYAEPYTPAGDPACHRERRERHERRERRERRGHVYTQPLGDFLTKSSAHHAGFYQVWRPPVATTGVEALEAAQTYCSRPFGILSPHTLNCVSFMETILRDVGRLPVDHQPGYLIPGHLPRVLEANGYTKVGDFR